MAGNELPGSEALQNHHHSSTGIAFHDGLWICLAPSAPLILDIAYTLHRLTRTEDAGE